MTAEDLVVIFANSRKKEISTAELYQIAIREYGVDDQYEDYEKHIRGLQQQLKKSGILVNTRRGYWALASSL